MLSNFEGFANLRGENAVSVQSQVVYVCLTKMHISGSPLKGLETKNTFERKMPGAQTGASEHYFPVRGARAFSKEAGIGL